MSIPATINDRFERIIAELYANNKRAFSIAVGISPTVVENIVGLRRGNPSYGVIQKVCANANINPIWLIEGTGNMLKSEQEETATIVQTSKNEGLPYYDVDFVGGFDETINDQTSVPDCYLSVPGFERADFWCNVRGNSMHPLIKNGDLIALKEVPATSIIYGEVYAIVLNELRTIKKVRSSTNKAKLRFIPINTEEFDEQEYHKQDIIRVFEVMGTISKFF